jgi:cytidylate kinase
MSTEKTRESERAVQANPAELIVIAIDGTAGSGKSTVARKLANKLGFVHLNSGALFRAVALESINRGIPAADDRTLAETASGLRFDFFLNDKGETVFTVNGKDIRSELSRDDVGSRASEIAVNPRLREVLAGVQRSVAACCSVVVEGRDATTVVFPSAKAKFFIDASLEIRAERRRKELAGLGTSLPLEQVQCDLRVRDQRDSGRTVAPLTQASDATSIDTSGLSIEEAVDRVCSLVKLRTEKEARK